MREKIGVLSAVHPFSRGLLILGGELSVVCNACATLLFAFANLLPQPAAAFELADQLAGGALRVLLVAVMVAFANDLAGRLLAKRKKRP